MSALSRLCEDGWEIDIVKMGCLCPCLNGSTVWSACLLKLVCEDHPLIRVRLLLRDWSWCLWRWIVCPVWIGSTAESRVSQTVFVNVDRLPGVHDSFVNMID